MAPRKWIDKNSATTYKLLHRPQNDPLIHDAEASSMVFQEQLPPQAQKKGLTLSDLHSYSETRARAGDSEYSFRANEGEAAEYGVYYDDTQYDYMQHLRDLGNDGGQFVEAMPVTVKGKGKGKEKVSLDEALKELDLDHDKEQAQAAGKLVDESILPSKNLRFVSYQAQQNVPDALAGFQPDMDPRLREALEALEDEAYVDNDDQDLFEALAEDGEEIDGFEDDWYDEEEGYESDDTAKPAREYEGADAPPAEVVSPGADLPSSETSALPPNTADATIPDATSDPFAAFNAHKDSFKTSTPASKPTPSSASAIKDSRMHGGAAASTVMSSASFLSKSGRKKRKGALTNPSAFSMTSSALLRTEGQTLLDARFDRMMETQYEEDEDMYGDDADTASVATGVTGDESIVSGMSAASSQAPDLTRKDFSSVMGVMDDFLGNFGGGPAQQGDSRASTRKGGKTRRGYGGQTGMEQLDEIRRDLGRPKVSGVR